MPEASEHGTGPFRPDSKPLRELGENPPVGLVQYHLRDILYIDTELFHELADGLIQSLDRQTKERRPLHPQCMALRLDRPGRRRPARSACRNPDQVMLSSVRAGTEPDEPLTWPRCVGLA